MSLAEIIYTYLVPEISDVLTGFGLSALLEFSRTSPEMNQLTPICLGVILASGALYALIPSFSWVPSWISLCNITFSLVITLSLFMNLISQLCPPSGKELSLIPAYIILCIPRMSPSGKALVLQCCLTLFILCVFLVPPTSPHARPDGDTGIGLSVAVSVAAGCLLKTFGLELDECSLYERSRWCGLCGVIFKGLLLLLLGSVKHTSIYYFMYDRPNTAPLEIFIGYGILLLFACMQTASVWFEKLREVLGRQVQWRLVVRIQHIIYALITAAAWAYPLQLHGLRVLILVLLLVLNASHGIFL
jgi:hypothetical protein